MIENKVLIAKKLILLLTVILVFILLSSSCTKKGVIDLKNPKLDNKQTHVTPKQKQSLPKNTNINQKNNSSSNVTKETIKLEASNADNESQLEKNLLKHISNNIEAIDNPSDSINFKINDTNYSSYRYYSPDYSTYIRCEFFYEDMDYFVKKLYIEDSTEPFHIKNLSTEASVDPYQKDSVLWIDNQYVILYGVCLYNTTTNKFWKLNQLSNINYNLLYDYTINNNRTHITYYTDNKIYTYSIYDDAVINICKISNETNNYPNYIILYDINDNIYFEESYEVIKDGYCNEYRKIYKTNIQSGEIQTLYNGEYHLLSSSFDGKYILIAEYDKKKKSWINIVLDTEANVEITKLMGSYKWSIKNYNLLNIRPYDKLCEILTFDNNNTIHSININKKDLVNYWIY